MRPYRALLNIVAGGLIFAAATIIVLMAPGFLADHASTTAGHPAIAVRQ